MYAAALLLQASIAAPAFAPPLDAAVRITTERSDSGIAQRRFKLERVVRFRREATGYRAHVRLLAAPTTAPDALTGMMDGGFGALVNATIVVHLDASGKVIAIDDMAALWARFCTGIGSVAAARKSLNTDARDALARQIAAPLLALAPERQRDLIGSLVTAAIAEPAPPSTGTEPVKVPGTSAYGATLILAGTRRSMALPSGEREVTIAAAADLPEEGRLELDSLTRSDPRTGMVVLDRETTRTWTRAGQATKQTTIQLALEPAEALK